MDIQKRVFGGFIVSLIAYTILLMGSISLMPGIEPLWGRVLISLLPMIPVVFLVRSVIQGIQALDEFQRRIHLEATAFSLIGTALVTFTYGFLEIAGLPPVSIMWVLPLATVLWGLGQFIANRRYG